jgi:hypothetical protein
MSTLACALVGLPPSDVEFFQTFFRLTATFGVSFTHTARECDADIFIVDASDSVAVDRLLQPVFNAPVLFVGDASPDPRWPALPRPFSLMKVLQLLQELAANLAASGCAPAATPQSRDDRKILGRRS